MLRYSQRLCRHRHGRVRLLSGVVMTAVVLAAMSWPLLPARGQSSSESQKEILPRTADGKPDLSGIWEPIGFGLAGDVDRTLGGLPYQPWAAAKFKENKANFGKDDPLARCLPPGVPRQTWIPFPMQFVQTPGQMVILYEGFRQFRIIPTDGRAHPEDVEPTWMGDSVGRWEGDTLVVDVVGLNGKTWFDQAGNFHSDSMHVIERYHRIDAKTIAYEATIDDPKTFTKPWKVTVSLGYVPDGQIMEFECMENNKDVEHLVGK